MNKLSLVIAVIGLIIGNVGTAESAGRSCEVYGIDQTQGVPHDISALFAQQRSARFSATPLDGTAVRRCRNTGSGTTTSTFLGPAEKYVGVCHYGESDISDLFSPDGKFLASNAKAGLSLLIQPDEYMLVTPGPCPRHGKAPYVATQGVTPGLFRMLVTAYTQIASSQKAFDAAFSNVKPDRRIASYIEAFKNSRHGWVTKVPSPISVNYNPAFFGDTNVGRYEVMSDEGWTFGFEFMQNGLRVVDLSLSAH